MYNPMHVGCTDPHVSPHRLPTKEHHQLDSTPRPPDSHNQGWTGHRAYRAMPEGPMHIFGPVPPPTPSVVGRNGRREEISRTSCRNSLFTAAPPPPVNNRDHPPPRRRSVLWWPGPNLVPSPALVTTLTPAKHTHIGGLHLLRLEHIRLHRSLLSGSHFSPKLKCCHSNTTPSSRLPPAGRNGRCKYRLWAAHVVAH